LRPELSEENKVTENPARRPVTGTTDEDADDALNPHRREEQLRAAQEARNRLSSRSITLTGDETPDQLADLQDAVERFEAAVQARGGDLFVDDLGSSQPENEALVLPRREPGEPVGAYTARIDAAGENLRKNRSRGDDPDQN
jgi:hypothetical protein